jgi:DNA-binding transcriptional regulator YiaG
LLFHGDMTRDEVIAFRKRLGLKQITVAKLAKVDRSKLSLWECGHVDLSEAEVSRVTHVLLREFDVMKNLPVPEMVTA